MSNQPNRRRTLDASATAERRKLTPAAKTAKPAVKTVVKAATPAKASLNAGDVHVAVPNAFNLVLDHHVDPIHYAAGTTTMPRAHAEHWWAKAHGVSILD